MTILQEPSSALLGYLDEYIVTLPNEVVCSFYHICHQSVFSHLIVSGQVLSPLSIVLFSHTATSYVFSHSTTQPPAFEASLFLISSSCVCRLHIFVIKNNPLCHAACLQLCECTLQCVCHSFQLVIDTTSTCMAQHTHIVTCTNTG